MIRAKKKQIEPIHAAFVNSGWSITQLSRESGVEYARVSYFVHKKQATVYTAGRLAIALVGFYEQCKTAPDLS